MRETAKYKLPLWDLADLVKRADVNRACERAEAAIASVDSAENRANHAAVQKYRQYWWRRRTVARTQVQGAEELLTILQSNEAGWSGSIRYSTTVVQDGSHQVTLGPATTIPFSYNTCGSLDLLGKYFELGGMVYYAVGNAFPGRVPGVNYTVQVTGKPVTIRTTYGSWAYLQSASGNAYPNSGESGGYEYESLGIPFDRLPTGAQIQAGHYIGTGAFGSGLPNTISIGFAPKLVIVYTESGLHYAEDLGNMRGIFYEGCFLWGKGITSVNVHDYNYGSNAGVQPVYFTETSSGLSWYNGSTAARQCNQIRQTYYYIAIG